MKPLHLLKQRVERARELPYQVIRNRLLSVLDSCERGELTVRDAFGSRTVRGTSEVQAELNVQDVWFYPRLALGGSVAMGETYRDGCWSSPDLVSLLQFFTLNRDQFVGGAGPVNLLGPLRKLYHWSRRNTQSGARRNIQEHYDLGNDFYQLFLDDSLTYSSAYFEDSGQSLQEAQRTKYRRLADRTNVQSGDRVLEIGTGWGGFALYLARERNADVVTTTISEEQYSYACDQVRTRGLEDQIRVLDRDYRALEGSFDRIVSVEMIEAVGEEFLSTFFAKIDDLLKPSGTVGLQMIHMLDQYYEEYRKSVDFIQRYIFPGGHLPSLEAVRTELKQTPFRIKELEENGSSYDETLRRWKNRLRDRRESVHELGYDEEFIRLWEYYFSYCQAGFRTGLLGNTQLVLDRPGIHQD